MDGPIDGSNETGDVLVVTPVSSLTPGVGNNMPQEDFVAEHREIGATFGVVYSRSSNSIFAAAYNKRHTAFGPSGTGAIYKVDLEGDEFTVPVENEGVSTFVDLNALFGANTAGEDPHPSSRGEAFFNRDSAAYDAVGQIGLGGFAISESGGELWTINLADRKLYQIPMGGTPDNPQPPAAVGDITVWPASGDLTGLPGLTGTASDIRPFGVKCYRDEVYIGLVNSAESTVVFDLDAYEVSNTGTQSLLRGFVYKLNPTSGMFTQVLSFPLDYTRGQAIDFCSNNAQAEFFPWAPLYDSDVFEAAVMGTSNNSLSGNPERAYPQPMLTDIEFTEDGKMILGIRDRFADQHGFR
ncbi:MAG: hypothetical protein AAF597_20105, partial [Bacteroidota bacterium]